MLVFEMMRFGTDAAQKNLDDRYFPYHQMMFGNSSSLWIHGILALITWILVIAVLVALLRWLWKKGDGRR